LFLAVTIGILLGSLCFLLADSLSAYPQAEGESVDATIFSDLLENGSSPMFDMEDMAIYSPSYYVDSNLWDTPLISAEQARMSAKAFLSHNLGERLLDNVSVNYQLLGGVRPTWILHIGPLESSNQSAQVRTQVYVNAITGDVIAWNLSTGGIAPGEDSEVSSEDAEEIAHEFLEFNNLSIPNTARYFGVNQYDLNINFFYIEFRHYESSFCVGLAILNPNSTPSLLSEGITIRVNKLTGQVTQFSYRWTKLSTVPNSGVISRSYAEEIALSNYSGNEYIFGSKLVLTEVYSRLSTDGSPQLHLSWVVIANISRKHFVFLVDAFSGEFLEERRTNGPVEIFIEIKEPSSISYGIVTFALISGVTVSVSTKYIRNRKNE